MPRKPAKAWVVEAGPSYEAREAIAVFRGPAAKETAEQLQNELAKAFWSFDGGPLPVTMTVRESRVKAVLAAHGIVWSEHPPCCEEVNCFEIQIINARSAPNANAPVQHPS